MIVLWLGWVVFVDIYVIVFVLFVFCCVFAFWVFGGGGLIRLVVLCFFAVVLWFLLVFCLYFWYLRYGCFLVCFSFGWFLCMCGLFGEFDWFLFLLWLLGVVWLVVF